MKVLSLLQPWASLVVLGHKKIETRSWNTKHRGPLLIHASASKKPVYRGITLDFQTQLFGLQIPKYEVLPFGAIIGQVELVGTCGTSSIKRMAELEMDGVDWETEMPFGDYTDGRFGWLLRDAKEFETPIPAKGSLGLWEYNEQHTLIV
jgi:hypothetical protein